MSTRLTRVTWVPAAVLVLLGVVGLWRRTPEEVSAAQAISYLIFGGGFAVAGAAASRVCRATIWVPLLTGGTALLAAQVLAGGAAGSSSWPARWSDVFATASVAVLLPFGVLRVPARDGGRVVLGVLDGAVIAAGLATVVAVGVGAFPVAAATGFTAGCIAFCAVWVQFELSSGTVAGRFCGSCSVGESPRSPSCG